MMQKLFGGFLVLVLGTAVMAKAGEPVGFEIRKRNSIGRWGPTGIHATVKAEGDGSAVVSFQAPAAGTYAFVYASGPNTGKTATTIKVEKAGLVSTKVKK